MEEIEAAAEDPRLVIGLDAEALLRMNAAKAAL